MSVNRIVWASYAVPPTLATVLGFLKDGVQGPAAVIQSVAVHFAAVGV